MLDHSYLKMNGNSFSFFPNVYPPIFSHLAQVRCLKVTCTPPFAPFSHPAKPLVPLLEYCSLCPLFTPLPWPQFLQAFFPAWISASPLTALPASSQTSLDLQSWLVLKCFLKNLSSLLKTPPWLIIVSEITSPFLSYSPACLSSVLLPLKSPPAAPASPLLQTT